MKIVKLCDLAVSVVTETTDQTVTFGIPTSTVTDFYEFTDGSSCAAEELDYTFDTILLC